jgi:cell fate regulator YaaT (PSP1 superfamily)
MTIAPCARPNQPNQQQERAMQLCEKKIKQHGLAMRLVKAEYHSDGSRLTFYFTADHRVDFRLLVRDLAYVFKTRIELRQIGPREAARLLGGVGICGRPFCCSTFLPDFAQSSVKMARDQGLPLNPTKISGACNRLLCCLSYEHQQYQELKKTVPACGLMVRTPDGIGEVVHVNVLGQSVTVQLCSSGMQEHYPLAQIEEVSPDGNRKSSPAPPRQKSDAREGERDRSGCLLLPDVLSLFGQGEIDFSGYEETAHESKGKSRDKSKGKSKDRSDRSVDPNSSERARKSTSSRRSRRSHKPVQAKEHQQKSEQEPEQKNPTSHRPRKRAALSERQREPEQQRGQEKRGQEQQSGQETRATQPGKSRRRRKPRKEKTRTDNE